MIFSEHPGLMEEIELNDKSFTLRMPTGLRDRLIAAKSVGLGSASQASVLRAMVTGYCDFVETMRRQPHDIEEVFTWIGKHRRSK